MAAAAIKHMDLNFAKLDKFEGVDFRRRQKKMHFLHSNMSVVYVLTTPILEYGDDATVEQLRKKVKWDNDDYICRGLILMDVSSKKFLVSNFTNYKKTNSRLVMEQYNELLGILERFTQHKMNMDEASQGSHLCIEESPKGSHLFIEESPKVHDSDKPKDNNVVGPSVVNMVENNNSSRNVAKLVTLKGIAKLLMLATKPVVQEQKGSVDGLSNLLKVQNMFNKFLQVDSGATIHVCKDRCWFKTYESLNDGSILYIGNESKALVHGRGYVDLRVWGCRAVVRLHDLKLKTLDERGIECIFVGYAKHSNDFRFFVVRSKIWTQLG
nr:hypothetical protein [Tanacetum cinerariifolium]